MLLGVVALNAAYESLKGLTQEVKRERGRSSLWELQSVECHIGSQDFSTADRDEEGKGEKFAHPGNCSVECSIGSQDFSTAERDGEGKGEKFAPGSFSVECSIREPQGVNPRGEEGEGEKFASGNCRAWNAA